MTALSAADPSKPVIVWFRRDLRLADQPALHHALATGKPVIPLFIWAPEEEAPWAPGAASCWWLHYSLATLSLDLQKLGSRLILRHQPSLDALIELIEETRADTLVWNRLYEPAIISRDADIKKTLRGRGVQVTSYSSHLLHEPWTILNQQDKPYQVFTPFYRATQIHGNPDSPLPPPTRLPPVPERISSIPLDALKLLPTIDWAKGFRDTWTPGEQGAKTSIERFISTPIKNYATQRDVPYETGTSRLSPHLHFGEISPRQIWYASRGRSQAEPYLRQLVWRDFAHHLLYHFPHTANQPLRSNFNSFPWKHNPEALAAWRKGRTGFPIVDAGMRELWHTGWMHNRVRMIVASFLVKDLLISWKEGAKWFWDTLVDADLANNTLGWQWAGGCGADAAPYFRIFNPELQSKKFDPEARYISRWVPELADTPQKHIHRPEISPRPPPNTPPPTPPRPPRTYPRPIVDHKQARDRALEAFHTLRS